jgi:hypothetical protein
LPFKLHTSTRNFVLLERSELDTFDGYFGVINFNKLNKKMLVMNQRQKGVSKGLKIARLEEIASKCDQKTRVAK